MDFLAEAGALVLSFLQLGDGFLVLFRFGDSLRESPSSAGTKIALLPGERCTPSASEEEGKESYFIQVMAAVDVKGAVI